MERLRKLVGGLVTAIAVCFLFANVITVQAYTTQNKVKGAVYIDAVTNTKGAWVNDTKRRIDTFDFDSISVEFGQGATIANLKSNKKGLELVQTYYDAYYGDHSTYDATGKYTGEFPYGKAIISMYATKAGTYKVTFDVKNTDGSTKKCTVTVLAANDNAVIKTATLGKTKLRTSSAKIKNGELTVSKKVNTKVKATSGKLKFTANTKYKITGMVVAGTNKSGKMYVKSYKNGKKVSLSQGYESKSNSAYSASSSRSARKYTYVYVSYKDTFTGDTCTFKVTSKRGKKEIVRTKKYKLTGETDTYYFNPLGGSYSSLALWRY